MMRYCTLFLVLLCASYSVSSVVVQTRDGPVQGHSHASEAAVVFPSIPFAAPPVGPLRFKAPQPVKPWTELRKDAPANPACPQMRLSDQLFFGDEDCLYLDIYAPTTALSSGAALPVMLFLYGGGFLLGDKNEFGMYDASTLVAKRNVVVVIPNYRLGPLGFYALDQLRNEDSDRSAGNAGFQDQVAALNWTRANIAKFGGDPNSVTIFGESAGAMSVCNLIASPSARGLFHRAISESGACEGPFVRPFSVAKAQSEKHARLMGCDPARVDVLDCLRKLPTGKIVDPNMMNPSMLKRWRESMPLGAAAVPMWPWGWPDAWAVTVDGAQTGFTDTPLKLIQSGQGAKVPVIIGTNRDEGTMFLMSVIYAGETLPLNPASLNRTVNHFFGNNTFVNFNLLNVYTQAKYPTSDILMSGVFRDYSLVCPSRRALRALAADKSRPASSGVYEYQFTHFVPQWLDNQVFGVYHASELEYVFGRGSLHVFGPAEHQVSNQFTGYWTNFAYTGNPNMGPAAAPGISWPVYNDIARAYVTIDSPQTVQFDLFKAECDFWDELYAQQSAAAV